MKPEKITQFLEQHVQWVAVGLGAIYLFWMAWLYVVQPPVTKQVKNEVVTPATIEEKIVEGPLASLKRAMTPKEQDMPVFKVPPLADEIIAQIGWKNYQPLVLAMPWINSATVKIQTAIDPAKKPEDTQPRFAVLPTTLPVAVAKGTSSGRSVVLPPAAAAVPGAAAPLPPLPPAGAAGADVRPANAVDKNWARPVFTLDPKGIAKAFDDAHLARLQPTTEFLLVEVMREELGPDGQWVNATVVPGLALIQMPTFPKEGEMAAADAYKEWASRNQDTILQPPFYQIYAGDDWALPGEVQAAAAGPAGTFDPATFVGDVSKLSPADRKTFFEFQQRKNAEEAKRRADEARQRNQQNRDTDQRRSSPRDRDMGGGRPPRRGSNYAPRDEQRPIQLAQANRPRGGGGDEESRAREQRRRDMEEDQRMIQEHRRQMQEDMRGGGPQGPQGPAQPNRPMQQTGPVGNVPNGPFRPAELGELTIWAIDETVQPNHQYRYKMRYYLLSPLYRTFNVAKNQEDANVFALTSDWSDWTTPVMILSDTEFLVEGGIMGGRDTARFIVGKWTGGTWHATRVTVSPGDLIGSNTNGVDFATGYTLVSVDPNTSSVILSDASGNLVKRDLKQDQSNKRFKELQQLVDNPTKPALSSTP